MIFARKQETITLSAAAVTLAAVVETKQLKPLLLTIALLFSTPAWADEIVIHCSNSAGVYASFKYKEGIFYDECYSRYAGIWEIMNGWTARNKSCFKDDTNEYVDFVTLKHSYPTISFHETCQKSVSQIN